MMMMMVILIITTYIQYISDKDCAKYLKNIICCILTTILSEKDFRYSHFILQNSGRFREVNCLVQDHTARKSWDQISNQFGLSFEPLLIPLLYHETERTLMSECWGMWIWVCICFVCICMHTCVFVFMYVCVYVHCLCIQVCLCRCICLRVLCVSIHVHLCAYLYTHVYLSMYVFLCLCMYICMTVYTWLHVCVILWHSEMQLRKELGKN